MPKYAKKIFSPPLHHLHQPGLSMCLRNQYSSDQAKFLWAGAHCTLQKWNLTRFSGVVGHLPQGLMCCVFCYACLLIPIVQSGIWVTVVSLSSWTSLAILSFINKVFPLAELPSLDRFSFLHHSEQILEMVVQENARRSAVQLNFICIILLTMDIVTKLIYRNIKIQDRNYKCYFIHNEQARCNSGKEKYSEIILERNLERNQEIHSFNKVSTLLRLSTVLWWKTICGNCTFKLFSRGLHK